MKKISFVFLILAVLSFINALGAKISYATEPETIPIHILSDKVVYNKDEHTYIFTGNVIITRKKFILKADKVVYFYKTDYAVATGNVIVNSKGTVTKAKKLKVYLKSKIGTIYNSHIHYLDKNIYVYGDKIYHKGKGFYQVKDGYLTSCKRTPPSGNCIRLFRIYTKGVMPIPLTLFFISITCLFYIFRLW
jgi:Organic solvent tolerance protein OstA